MLTRTARKARIGSLEIELGAALAQTLGLKVFKPSSGIDYGLQVSGQPDSHRVDREISVTEIGEQVRPTKLGHVDTQLRILPGDQCAPHTALSIQGIVSALEMMTAFSRQSGRGQRSPISGHCQIESVQWQWR